MGGFFFSVSLTKKNKFNMDYINSFMKSKYRGKDDTQWLTETTCDIATCHQSLQKELTRDEINNYTQYTFSYGYHRLAINDSSFNGSQPFTDPIQSKTKEYRELLSRPQRRLMCFGEIYNYNELKETLEHPRALRDLQSTSDVEIIMPLYLESLDRESLDRESLDRESLDVADGATALDRTLNRLDGEYALVLTENIENNYKMQTMKAFVARDPFGLRPLYVITFSTGIVFTSDLKMLPVSLLRDRGYNISVFPQGHFWSFNPSNPFTLTGNLTTFYNTIPLSSLDYCTVNVRGPSVLKEVYSTLYNKLKTSVEKRVNTNTEMGVLLSPDGVDSNIILILLVTVLRELNHNFTRYPLHTFSLISPSGSKVPHLVNSLETQYGIDIHHHNVVLSEEAILHLLNTPLYTSDIIYYAESYEPEVVKECMYFYELLKYIKETNPQIRVIFTGDGADELFGGYPQFRNMTDSQFQYNAHKLVTTISDYDIRRADKIGLLNDIEIRYPFLSKDVVEYVFKLHPILKGAAVVSSGTQPVDKFILRKAFEAYIPTDVLVTEHRCMCETTQADELINEYYNTLISDTEYSNYVEDMISKYNYNTLTLPVTKEQMYYRQVYNKKFPTRSDLITTFWTSLVN